MNILSGLAGTTSWRFDAEANSVDDCYLVAAEFIQFTP